MKAGKCGAIDVLIDVMEKHISSINVCELGCSALMNISAVGKFAFANNTK